MRYEIKIHSVIDVITNSSTELFVVDKQIGLELVREMIRQECALLGKSELAWFYNECRVSLTSGGNIEIYSFLNMPDEVRALIINELNGYAS